MEIKFKNLVFEVLDGKIQISRIGELILTGGTIAEIHIAGEDKPQNFGAKLGNSSEGEKLLYSYHEEKNDSLIICQSSTLLRARTVFTAFENTQTIQVHTQIENISQTDIFVEEVSAFMLSGFSKMKKSLKIILAGMPFMPDVIITETFARTGVPLFMIILLL